MNFTPASKHPPLLINQQSAGTLKRPKSAYKKARTRASPVFFIPNYLLSRQVNSFFYALKCVIWLNLAKNKDKGYGNIE